MRNYIEASKPLFPFGYGLSYTTFDYKNLRISPKEINIGDTTTISVTVKNTGFINGEEIVQLYIHDEVSSITRPIKELKGFQKNRLIPGESKVVEFIITSDELQFYNNEMRRMV